MSDDASIATPRASPQPRGAVNGIARRNFIVRAMAAGGWTAGVPVKAWSAPSLVVDNVTALYEVQVAKIERPVALGALQAAVKAWPGKIAIGGGRYSMGGQTAVQGGLHLDMRSMNQLVWLRPAEKVARVQAGMRWRDLQDHLDPHGLAVKTMQSYSNFSIGGAVSVNAHGRYVGHGPVGHSVRALQVMLADGRVLEASARENTELFRAAIGGYGAVGVITEVELALAENVRIERRVTRVPLQDYVAHFEREVRADPEVILHNADLTPPGFDLPVAVSWRRCDKPLTMSERLVPRHQAYGLEQNAVWAFTELPGGERLRSLVAESRLRPPIVQWLNHEASLDAAMLEPRTRRFSTYVLQEYFVPAARFLPFVEGLSSTLRRHEVEALNVSIRHSPADTVSLLPWAKGEVFCFVLYYKQRTHAAARDEVGKWTRSLIDLALANGGRYYLPYQLHARQGQFDAAYPEAAALRAAKQRWDPDGRFSNELWRRYL